MFMYTMCWPKDPYLGTVSPNNAKPTTHSTHQQLNFLKKVIITLLQNRQLKRT